MAIGWFVLGLLLLALGGDMLLRGAAGLARGRGWSPFRAGLILVALASSIPEIVVNAIAVGHGQDELAIGNAVGSNVANVGLTLALAAIAAPLLVRWRALSALLAVLLAVTAAALLLALDGRLSALEGMLLVAAFVGVLAFKTARSDAEDPDVRAEIESFMPAAGPGGRAVLHLVAAAVLLAFGGWLVVRGAPDLGEALGLSPLLTGLLPVAIGTTLPEAAAAIAAARRGQGDLVAGHVIGSSLVNMTLVLGGTALFAGGIAIPLSLLRYDLPAALVFSAMLLPILRGDMRVSRGEGGALAAAFVAWIAFELLMLRG